MDRHRRKAYSTVISKLVGKRVIERNGKEYSIQKDYDLWLSPEQESPKHVSHEQVIEITQTGEDLSHEQVNGTPLISATEAGSWTPKDILKTSFKDISLRERLLKEMKKIFPALSIPDFIPDEKLDFLIYKIGKGEIRADSIKNPLAYLKAMTVSETFPPFLERETKAEKKRQEDREKREREKEEEEKAHQNREYHRDKAREVLNQLSGRGTWKTSTKSGTSIVVQ